MTLKSPSVTASTKRPPMPPWSTVRSSRSRLGRGVAGALFGSSIMALTSSPAASASIALALRSTSSRQLSSDRKRTAATTTRKMTISVGIERLQQRLGGEQAAIGRLGDEARMSARTAFLAGPAPDKNRAVGRAPRVRIRHAMAPLSLLPSLTIRLRRTPESSVKNQR